jgi:transcriptional regulator with XRE-family HTH domain|tara:strand:- start:157 stop:531 length:375 start_codon:yes stop_codon:yes gene_type:complete
MGKTRVPFHIRIKSLRESRGLSYRGMAAELKTKYGIEVSATAIQKWEMGEQTRLPARNKISAICQLFNVSPAFLLDELFGVEVAATNDRLALFADIEMLNDHDFDALLQIKNSLAARSSIKLVK